MYSLVFFLALIIESCSSPADTIGLVYKNGRATGIQIPAGIIGNMSVPEARQSIKLVRSGDLKQTGILGDFTGTNGSLLFSPLIPLTPGLKYLILQGNRSIGSVTVLRDSHAPPKLIAVYPATDTLPENTLKLYLHFLQPMRTGQALNYVCLLDKNKDTMRNVLLDLQPELWDTSRTVLTLWLDPGRIKRGLVLNRQLGNPLKNSEKYELVVSKNWKDTYGNQLNGKFNKYFVAGERDENKPDVSSWKVSLPRSGSKTALFIDAGNPLDHYLFQECITVMDADGADVKGKVEIGGQDRVWTFTPIQPWKAQCYTLRVLATLEDLAGNNLNRVFDRDITKDKVTDKQFIERGFAVK